MQVKLEKEYPIAADIESAWKILGDLPELASCMPGAQITERIDDRHFKGQVKVQVGPATAAFGGTIELLDLDATARMIRLQGKGADRSGSSASMDLTASLKSQGAGACTLIGVSDVIVNGKFAQFGGRMMNSISDMILGQFAQNFAVRASAIQAAGTPGVAQPSERATEALPPDAPPAKNDLDALALAWGLIKNFFSGLLGRKRPG